MGFGNPGVFVKRAYREGKPFQWLREGKVNCDEAGATKILIDVERESYATHGLLRLQIEDNGCGIKPDDVDKFLNTFGGGGKPIGDEHDNFGVGVKSATLPWNNDGVVVRSLVDGELSISVLVFDEATNEIGLIHLPLDTQDDVDQDTDYDTTIVVDESDIPTTEWVWQDIDWIGSFPEWIIKEGHGTVLTFLGTAANPDTFFGDPNVAEEQQSRYSYIWYCDRRFWTIPKGHEFKIGGADSLDRKRIVAALDKDLKRPVPARTKHWEKRRVRGLLECIYMVPKKAGLPVDTDEYEDEASVTSKGWVKHVQFDIGSANLPATCHVYFKDVPGIDPNKDYGWDPARYGIITALYKNECYDIERGHRHRQFGIPYSEIYNKVWIVIEPVLAGKDDEAGVYPGTSRSHLHWKGHASRAMALPWDEWADEFVARMADEVPFLDLAIKNYISAAQSGDEIEKNLLRRTADRFLSRFKPLPKPPRYTQTKRRVKRRGEFKEIDGGKVDEPGDNPGSSGGVRGKSRRRSNPTPGPNSGKFPGDNDGNKSGTKTLTPDPKGALHIVRRGQNDDDLPPPQWVLFSRVYPDLLKEAGKADLGVVYEPSSPAVNCNIEHAVILEVIEHYVKEFGTRYRKEVTEGVHDVYGMTVSTAVGHIVRQKLDPDTLAHRLEDLTSKWYGLYDVDHLVRERIRARIGRKVVRPGKTAP